MSDSEPDNYDICEAAAYIANLAGTLNYRCSGMGQDVFNFIMWGQEFQRKNADVDWGQSGREFPDEIRAFALMKFKSSGGTWEEK